MSKLPHPSAQFWKNKLAAYLHDTPSKTLDIHQHESFSLEAFKRVGLVTNDEEKREFERRADHLAAAADRFPFPHYRASRLNSSFDGEKNAFTHPMGPATEDASSPRIPFPPFRSTAEGLEVEQTNQTIPSFDDANFSEEEKWRALYFLQWRLWPQFSMEKDYRFGFLPADTRIPDHTIWNHMAVVSSLAGSLHEGEQPAFLKFQLGGVQEFISQARNTRDLWSGSYLLSWLISKGLYALSQAVGPDAVIFPNLRQQPLFDLQWKKDLWDSLKAHSESKPYWHSLGLFQSGPEHGSQPLSSAELLIPNLPNVFLAVVPFGKARKLAQEVESTIRQEWQNIAHSVWDFCSGQTSLPSMGKPLNLFAKDGLFKNSDERQKRFNQQVDHLLDVAWQAEPWPATLAETLSLGKTFSDADQDDPETSLGKAAKRLHSVIQMATEDMPPSHRDERYYTDKENKTELKNPGNAWSVLLTHQNWLLDAVRQTKAFTGWQEGGWTVGTRNQKDALNGKEEAIAGGRKWQETCQKEPFLKNLFSKTDFLGASTLIKRLWHLTYLSAPGNPWGFVREDFKMPNTLGIAMHDPFAQKQPNDTDRADIEESKEPSGNASYLAVLALDGDQIGQWVSGEKCPSIAKQLSSYQDGSGHPQGALEYFTRESVPEALHGEPTDGQTPDNRTLKERYASFLQTRRPLSPGYHLQFSEALSNFARFCTKPIVEAFDGRLIYAGGDDVLALLPADTALDCSKTLRAAFRGDPELPDLLAKAPSAKVTFAIPAPGFVSRSDWCEHSGARNPIPFIVPGPAAECSAGICIGHYKAPLQDLVKQAQTAEKRAKKKISAGGLERAAVALTLLKRSGETIHWGAKWNSGGVALLESLTTGRRNQWISSRFPYRLTELLEAYADQVVAAPRQSNPDFPAAAIIQAEWQNTLLAQKGEKATEKDAAYQDWKSRNLTHLETYLQSLPDTNPAEQIKAVIGLAQTFAFAYRQTETS